MISLAAPLALLGLFSLPLIWWLLRLTPPKPRNEFFPPFRLLLDLVPTEQTPAKSPWWITLIRILLVSLIILAFAKPWLRPSSSLDVQLTQNTHIILDNSWPSAKTLQQQKAAANNIANQAFEAGQLVRLTSLSQADLFAPEALTKSQFQAQLAAIETVPVALSVDTLRKQLTQNARAEKTLFLSNGMQPLGWSKFFDAAANSITILGPESVGLKLITETLRRDGQLAVRVEQRSSQAPIEPSGVIVALDNKSRQIARVEMRPENQLQNDEAVSGELFSFDMPLELSNEIDRVVIAGQQHAAATYLIDESARHRRVAVISSNFSTVKQPLLTPPHYLENALLDKSQIVPLSNAPVAEQIETALQQKPATVFLTNAGTLLPRARELLERYLANGGTLVRFASFELAQNSQNDDLFPVTLRQSERVMGGSLSWSKPQNLAAFADESIFRGIEISNDISIRRQVLAEPDIDLTQKTWARLSDGTPIVTAQKIGNGRLIFFHTSADASWSNLALSQTFIQMLAAIVNTSKILTLEGPDAISETQVQTSFAPYKTIDFNGRLGLAAPSTKPLSTQAAAPSNFIPTTQNPPGLYGVKNKSIALNLYSAKKKPAALFSSDEFVNYPTSSAVAIAPYLFVAALILLLADSILVLWMQGAFKQIKIAKRQNTFALLALATATLLAPKPAIGQTEDEKWLNTLPAIFQTSLGYVLTGNAQVDEISEAGMRGLSYFITTRTALEPTDPIGLDLETDELAFFPLIYWPILPDAEIPSQKALTQLNYFMKNGGTVLFDTRDNTLQTLFGRQGRNNPAQLRLAQMLRGLDIPPLEPVPSNHVLTKSFYILDNFPGRYESSQLWVEAQQTSQNNQIVRADDGVSSILITGNDFAGAWAMGANGRPLLPTSSSNPRQRMMAYRAGVNIVMYTLTGNYKSDQVHIPDLIERLGQ